MVPILEGDSNMEAWKDTLLNELRAFKVLEFIKDDVPEPADAAVKDKWENKCHFINNILHRSL